MREYEKHQEANGKPPNHQMAKELLAGIVGAEVRPKQYQTMPLQLAISVISLREITNAKLLSVHRDSLILHRLTGWLKQRALMRWTV